MLARRLDPGRCPPSHQADPWLVGRWSAGTLTAGRRPGCEALCLPAGWIRGAARPVTKPTLGLSAGGPPRLWLPAAAPGVGPDGRSGRGTLLARQLVLGSASSPMTAADPWLVGPCSDYGYRPPPRVLGPGDRPGKALLAYRI